MDGMGRVGRTSVVEGENGAQYRDGVEMFLGAGYWAVFGFPATIRITARVKWRVK
jgi:hypothetical protein